MFALTFVSEDSDFARVYFKRENARHGTVSLFCFQRDRNVWRFYFCTPEGEPIAERDYHTILPFTPETEIGRALLAYLESK